MSRRSPHPHETTSAEVKITRCELHCTIRSANCGQGFANIDRYSHANGFRTASEFTYRMSQDQCELARSGKMIPLTFGTQNTMLAPAGITNKTQMFLHGSALHENQTCVGASGPVFLSPTQPQFNQDGNLIVELSMTLHVVAEKARLELDKVPIVITIPRLGTQGTLSNGQFFKQTNIGTLVGNFSDITPQTECDLYKIVTYSSFELYSPKNNQRDVPPIVTVKLPQAGEEQSGTMLGLQLTYDIDVCGTRCQATQIDNIVVCTGLINENLPLTDQEN